MKLLIIFTFLSLSVLCSVSYGQDNCCQISTGPVQISNESTATVSSTATAPGGTYTATITQTYAIMCNNSSSGKAVSCNTSPNAVPNNVVNGTGAGANFGTRFVQCNPVFTPTLTQSTASSAGTFVNVATNFSGVDPTGACIKANATNATSQCPTPATVAAAECAPPCTKPPPPVCSARTVPEWDASSCQWFCIGTSPIVIDVSGNGFQLTSAANGVHFDISGNGTPIEMGWTAPGAANAFLCLPDSDGKCDDGKNLFGNFTPQPASNHPNGFAALAVYDNPKNGGNSDGVIDSRDAIFASLRLWIDTNHDGISEPEELHTLPSLGVNSISLDYHEARRTDQYGNLFRYQSKVNPDDPDASHVGRTAYDVFFVTDAAVAAAVSKCRTPVVGLLPKNSEGLLSPR